MIGSDYQIKSVSEHILKVLKNNNNLMSIEAIAEELEERHQTINLALSRLICSGDVEIESIGNKNFVRMTGNLSPRKEISHDYYQRKTYREKLSSV